MSEKHIPPDIMDKAQAAWDEAANQPTDTRAEVTIALAILTERERSAAIIEPYTTDRWKRALRTIMMGCLEKIKGGDDA